MDRYSTDTPIYALSTAPFKSALAVIRTSGDGSVKLLSEGFSRKEKLLGAKNATLVHGNLVDSDGIVDEVVLAVYRDGHGYTGEEAVEISCHGSMVGIRRICRLLEKLGFRKALGGEFTFRAFMHGRMDLTEAEAVGELIDSKGEKAQKKAIERLEGTLRKKIDFLKKRILDILASIEVQLDYAEDEIPEEWEFPEEEVGKIMGGLSVLISSYASSKISREGAKVVLAGSPNAGKSSLFNLILKENRSIVSAIPGTTRDYIEAGCEICGIPITLCDTAGLREGHDEIESEGIKRSLGQMDDADLVVRLVPPGEEYDGDDEKVIPVYSKCDEKRREGFLSISSVTGEGIGALLEEIGKRLLSADVGSDVSIDSSRQRDCLAECLDALSSAKEHKGESLDVVALYFQSALTSLGMVTGEVTQDDLLETLFSSFCVGK